jgi:hypothetical protein
MKFYIKAALLKTSCSRMESSLCEEKSTRLVIEFELHESKDWKGKSNEPFAFIVPCDELLPIYITERICTSYPHSMNVATPCLPRPSDERLHLEHSLRQHRVLPKRTETCLPCWYSSFSSGRSPPPECS